MTNTKKTIITAIFIVFILCVIAIGIFFAQHFNTKKTVTYSLDWNAKYDTFAEAYGAADCVVTGKVKSLNTYEYNQVVFTEALLDTTEIFKGSPEGDIRVLFTGGVLNNTEYKAEEVVLPASGDTFLFLLSEKDNLGHRSPVGGYQGMFRLKDTKTGTLRAENNSIVAFNSENELEQDIISAGNNLYHLIEEQTKQ